MATPFDQMNPREKMNEILKDMGKPSYTRTLEELTGEFLDAHGIEAKFIVENVCLLQLLNERPDILAELKSKYGY